jgi:putative phage-type endonuclease
MESVIHTRVQELLLIPQYEQRTPEWYRQRDNAITASDIPTVLGENHYKTPWTLLMDKCNANPKPFVGNSATRWGNHYEDIAIEKYSERYNKKVLSFGLLIHRDYDWLGGSPDGITTDGILLEVKCPLKRKIVMGEVPEHYLSQVLLNLEICDLEMGHFIEFIPGNSDNDFVMNVVEVKRNREWFSKELPKMKEFWDNVLKYREEGIQKHPKYRPPRAKKEEGITLNIDTFFKKESKYIPFIEDEYEIDPEPEPEPVTFVPFLDEN